jgi:hypothetical protein
MIMGVLFALFSVAENKKPTRLRVGWNFFLLLRLQIRPSLPI